MNEKTDLDSFIVKKDGLDEALLTETAKLFLSRILPDGTIEYNLKFQKFNAARKILAELIAKKIKSVKKVAGINSEEVSLKELMNKKNNLGASEESIKKSFNRELKGITQKGEQGYFIPNYNLHLLNIS